MIAERGLIVPPEYKSYDYRNLTIFTVVNLLRNEIVLNGHTAQIYLNNEKLSFRKKYHREVLFSLTHSWTEHRAGFRASMEETG